MTMNWYSHDRDLGYSFDTDNENCSLNDDNLFDIESVFIKKQNSFNDYEEKINEFVLGNSLPGEWNIKDENGNGKKNSINLKMNERIFDVTKSQRKNFNSKSKKKILTKEEFDKHPFIFPHNNCIESEQHTIENKIEHKINKTGDCNSQSLFREIIDNNDVNSNFECDSLFNNDSCIEASNRENIQINPVFPTHNSYNILANGKTVYPSNRYFPLQSLPLSERMRIKKEKTKLLLEKKTQRDALLSDKENTHHKNSPFSVTPPTEISHYTMNTHNTLSTGSQSNKCEPEIFFTQNTYSDRVYGVSKKEIKMLRNRISAQRSRDRKKKEFDDLKIISQNLLNQNYIYKKELEIKDRELADIKSKINLICNNCQGIIRGIPDLKTNSNTSASPIMNDNIIHENGINSENSRYSLVDVSHSRNFSSSLKYSIMAGLLVIICLVGVFSIGQNNSNNTRGRVLTNVEDKDISNINHKALSNNQANGVILYNNNFVNNISNSKTNPPFSISKDIDKLIKKNQLYWNNSIRNSNSLPPSEEINFPQNISRLEQFLQKKQIDFYNKMAHKKLSGEGGFLQKSKNEMCVDIEGVSLSIQNELNSFKQDFKNSIHVNSKINENIINTNDGQGLILNNPSVRSNPVNPVVPFGDRFENSILRENIKSMYCRDFITTAEENSQMFKNMFDKLNMAKVPHQENSSDNVEFKSKNENDCLYLHMIVQDMKMSVVNDQKIYYEVGCKVFEINKIFMNE